MFERFHQKSAKASVAAILAALGVGGVALAESGGTSSSSSQSPAPATAQSPTSPGSQATEAPGQESNALENSAADRDDLQQGDQREPSGSAGAGSEKESATEQESGSEKVDDDGPGGHADEPANPNADHQAQGQE